MRRIQLLSTVAAAVLLSFGAASAQSNNGEAQRSPHHSQQMNQSGARSTEAIRNGQSKQHNGGARQHSAAGHASQHQNAKNAGAQKSSTTGQANQSQLNEPKASSKQSETTGQAPKNEAKGQQNAGATKASTSHHAKRNESGRHNAGVKKHSTTGQAVKNQSQSQNKAATKSNTTGQGANHTSQGQKKTATKAGTTDQAMQKQSSGQNAGAAKSRATGQASTQQTNSAAKPQGVKLSTRQVTKVRQTVFSRNNVPRVSHVDFSVRVGSAIPTHVDVVAVPQRLVEIYPAWRDDDYFVAENEIIIVDHSRKIVAVIPARGHEAGVESSSTTTVNLNPDQIRQVQLVLIRDGYLHGDADGVYGPETRDALIEFQRHEGIRVTGHIDRRTVSSLGLSSKIQVGGAKANAGTTSSTVGQAPREQKAGRQNSPRDNQAERPNNNSPSHAQARHERSTTGQGRSIQPSRNAAQPHANKNIESSKDKNSSRSIPSTTGQGSDEPSTQNPAHNKRHRNESGSSK
jgi:Putative peptidoglycan binding domain/Protein of unknown function (DUF1236)